MRGRAPTTCPTRVPIPPTSTVCPVTPWARRGCRWVCGSSSSAPPTRSRSTTGPRPTISATAAKARAPTSPWSPATSCCPCRRSSARDRRGSRSPGSRGTTPTSRWWCTSPRACDRASSPSRARAASSRPRRRGPRWIAYGDSIAEGWIASGPAGAWPSVAARRHGLDLVNLGYAGSARGELPSAQHVAALDADVISISHGTNCWSRIPFSAALFAEQTRAFLALVRQGHPDTPIVVTSPILRPDAETTPNALGATLRDLRVAMEDVTRELIAAGDARLDVGGGRRRDQRRRPA